MSKVIQIRFSDSEMEFLSRKAEEKGVTVPIFIKGEVLSDTEFNVKFEELKKRVKHIPVGTDFSIKAVFGVEWGGISKGVRLALGKAFYAYIDAGNEPTIEIKPDKDSANTQWYKIKGEVQ